ncbi:MAG: hypothetical protein AB7S38_35640 [Vulcanimicrobiota bacterium]
MAVPGIAFGGQNFATNQLFQRPLSSPPLQQIAGNPQLAGQFQQLLQVLIGALSQLSQGYQSFGGYPTPGFPNPGFPGQPPFGTPPFGTPTPGTPIFGGYNPPVGGYPTPGTPTFPPAPGGASPTDPRFFNWGVAAHNGNAKQAVSTQQRTSISGLDDGQRAILHLWGRQMTAGGKQDGSIYFNVLNDKTGAFTPAEHALVEQAYAREMAMYGGVTGKELDRAFFGLYGQMTGEDISGKYGNAPVHFSNGQQLDLSNNNQALGEFGNTVMRLWGHDRLDNGRNDGSILAFSLQNPDVAFDSAASGANQQTIESLAAADMADDGVLNNSSLSKAFSQTLDQAYFGAPSGNNQQVLQGAGISTVQVGSILDKIKNSPIPGVPAGVDITNIANIGKCPVLGQSVQQSGLGGVGFFG